MRIKIYSPFFRLSSILFYPFLFLLNVELLRNIPLHICVFYVYKRIKRINCYRTSMMMISIYGRRTKFIQERIKVRAQARYFVPYTVHVLINIVKWKWWIISRLLALYNTRTIQGTYLYIVKSYRFILFIPTQNVFRVLLLNIFSFFYLLPLKS